MSRYSSAFATRLAALSLLFITFSAQGATLKPDSSSLEVAYLLDGSMVQTYNVEPATGNAIQEGSEVTLDAASNVTLIPSPNDHFLYVTGNDSSNVEWLWVYATDSTGAPQLPAVQALNLADGGFSVYQFVISPTGTLAYMAESMYTSQYFVVAKIAGFTIDSNTGIVTRFPKPVATYHPNGPCLLTASAFFSLYGVGATGKELYDKWECIYPFGNDSAQYFSRTINPSTGAVGPDKTILDWADGNEGFDIVSITGSSLVYYSDPSIESNGQYSLNVYALNGTYLFSCTDSNLEACGYGIGNVTDRTGQWDLIALAPDLNEVLRIELGQKQVVDTKNYVQGYFQAFAPDDALIYTLQPNQSNPWVYPIYVFDPSTGSVTYNGGNIWDLNGPGTVVTALRQ